mmetsp:Transcript_43118/g.131350  ORF Transcript_43118/g.131350 Transcript_43118/m.131350 type:complete len:191 (-) Transcript_43118:778-1350(-)|eukprot:CAMPEP_0113568276 /NCGR_PEP_ID=MMETSP0015_2-20120614/23760_1 /TAXON_ID=2838 /ORGANISM="Odontella" /LENGTH=190 /DNA_ID=CAMNT_0000470801 /DNA_START=519 /DNA_END=1091 /DNA_ORIENTATION=+ /assembly_acc=CAM_ASM_000160
MGYLRMPTIASSIKRNRSNASVSSLKSSSSLLDGTNELLDGTNDDDQPMNLGGCLGMADAVDAACAPLCRNVRWHPRVVSETRTTPRMKREEASRYFYTRREYQEFRSLAFRHRRATAEQSDDLDILADSRRTGAVPRLPSEPAPAARAKTKEADNPLSAAAFLCCGTSDALWFLPSSSTGAVGCWVSSM